jgi:hypothetical protein
MPQISDEAIFIGLILGIALFILLILLASVVFIQHYEHRGNDRLTLKSLLGTITDLFPNVRKKKEATPSPPDDTVIQTAPETAPNIEHESARITKPESLPDRIKTLNWIVCFIIAAYVAWSNYWRVHFVVANTSLNIYIILLSIISPTCFAVVWLRLTGFEWRRALQLFIWVSVTIGGIVLLLPYIGFFLKYYSGHCC